MTTSEKITLSQRHRPAEQPPHSEGYVLVIIKATFPSTSNHSVRGEFDGEKFTITMKLSGEVAQDPIVRCGKMQINQVGPQVAEVVERGIRTHSNPGNSGRGSEV